MPSQIKGARAMARTLRLLPKAIGEKALVGALRAGGQVIRKEAIIRLGDPGGAKKIVVRRRPRRAGAAASVMVTITRKAFTLMFREYGTAAHVIEAGQAQRGAGAVERRFGGRSSVLADVGAGEVFGARVAHPGQRARPFFRPAFDARAQAALDKIGQQLGRNIERAAARLAGPLARSGLIKARRRRR